MRYNTRIFVTLLRFRYPRADIGSKIGSIPAPEDSASIIHALYNRSHLLPIHRIMDADKELAPPGPSTSLPFPPELVTMIAKHALLPPPSSDYPKGIRRLDCSPQTIYTHQHLQTNLMLTSKTLYRIAQHIIYSSSLIALQNLFSSTHLLWQIRPFNRKCITTLSLDWRTAGDGMQPDENGLVRPCDPLFNQLAGGALLSCLGLRKLHVHTPYEHDVWRGIQDHMDMEDPPMLDPDDPQLWPPLLDVAKLRGVWWSWNAPFLVRVTIRRVVVVAVPTKRLMGVASIVTGCRRV